MLSQARVSVTDLLGKSGSEQAEWLDSLGERLQESTVALFASRGQAGKRVEDFLHGTWYGHALHPALILAPAGAWVTAALLDAVGIEDGADAAIGFGIVSSLPAAASGMVDWAYTSGKVRRVGLVHALLNSASLVLYGGSWLARKSGSRGLGIGLSTLGLGVMGASAYLGGELSYSLGQGVNRASFRLDVADTSETVGEFRVVAKESDVLEGQLASGEFELDGATFPLVLLKRDGVVHAIDSVCTHLGGPLADGTLVGEWCVECPWHGSQFDMRDGQIVQGPAAYPQPRYETRIANGNVEARLAR